MRGTVNVKVPLVQMLLMYLTRLIMVLITYCKREKTLEPGRRMAVDAEDRSNESIMEDPDLQAKHSIFLSYSGLQQDFVEQLCEDLERQQRFPFFDKRPSSLPKGEKFPELIFKATRQCQMAVLVVSQEYFESKWPMIELHAFVQALKSNSNLKILPLFVGLSINEFRDKTRQNRWFTLWDSWAKVDSRIKVNEWRDALKVILKFNGIEYNQKLGGIVAYRKDIVSNICNAIPPDVMRDDSYFQGRSYLCKAILQKIQKSQPSSIYKVRIVGIFGVGGIGKTTICKTLCNEFSREFKGKVCHAEIGSMHSEELLKKVLHDLTNTNKELLQHLEEDKCRYMLHTEICKQKTFLVLDNVWDDSKSIEEAKMYLQASFQQGSLVMVTSRSLSTLAYLGIDKTECSEMPELQRRDAENLFLYHAAYGMQFTNVMDKHAIGECVARCYFQKGDKQRFHYSPLALKTLGTQLGCVGSKPSDWVINLPKVRDFNYFQEENNPVFSILRSTYDRLREEDQNLFMDVALYTPDKFYTQQLYGQWPRIFKCEQSQLNIMEWLSHIHKQKVQEIERRLQCLKEKALLEDVDMRSQKISIHDLYREFAELESKGKLNMSLEFEKRRWVYTDTYPTELDNTPSGRCWPNLIRVGIIKGHALQNLQGIQWRYCSNVVVLKLVGLKNLQGILDLKGLRCLRSLELYDNYMLQRLDGLEDLKNLTYFRWCQARGDEVLRDDMGQLQESLKFLQVDCGVWFRPDSFDRCSLLCKLELWDIRADILDFSNCKSLQSVMLIRVQLLQSIRGLAATCLQSLEISSCMELQDLCSEAPGFDHMVGLKQLRLYGNAKLKKLPNLQKLTKLEELHISWMKYITELPGLGSLRQLPKLECVGLGLTQVPNLSGLQQLRVVNFSYNNQLTSLEGVLEGLPALQCVNLSGCELLSRLPDLSRSKNLEVLNLDATKVLIQEEYIHSLGSLPLLRRVGRLKALSLEWYKVADHYYALRRRQHNFL